MINRILHSWSFDMKFMTRSVISVFRYFGSKAVVLVLVVLCLAFAVGFFHVLSHSLFYCCD